MISFSSTCGEMALMRSFRQLPAVVSGATGLCLPVGPARVENIIVVLLMNVKRVCGLCLTRWPGNGDVFPRRNVLVLRLQGGGGEMSAAGGGFRET